jgi:hypothetical protein
MRKKTLNSLITAVTITENQCLKILSEHQNFDFSQLNFRQAKAYFVLID